MSNVTEQVIAPDVIEGALSYDEYRKMIDELLEEGKTTGDNHSDAMGHYTKMNVQRMSRWDKRVELKDSLVEALDEVESQWIWLVLTEAWCGDAAQNIPAIVKMAEQSDNIDIQFILRDEHLDIMDEYLTNGGRSIPKLICLDANSLEDIGTWGPRPDVAQKKSMKWKNDDSVSTEEWAKNLHKWYAKNRNSELQDEFEQLIKQWQN